MEFVPGRVGWAEWIVKKNSYAWPCIIDGITKDSRGTKATIRYFETKSSLEYKFKLHPSKVELFFRNEQHFDNKVILSN